MPLARVRTVVVRRRHEPIYEEMQPVTTRNSDTSAESTHFAGECKFYCKNSFAVGKPYLYPLYVPYHMFEDCLKLVHTQDCIRMLHLSYDKITSSLKAVLNAVVNVN